MPATCPLARPAGMQIARLLVGALVLGLSGAMTTSMALAVELPGPESEAWEPLTFRSIRRETHYQAEPDPERDGRSALRADSHCSASARIFRLDPETDLHLTPILSWRWKVDETPTPPEESSTNERRPEGDDFAARVYVLFGFDPESASLWKRAVRRVASAVYGDELPGHALSYVWARSESAGSSWVSPRNEDTQIVVLRTGDSGTWRHERVDLLADHRRLVGDPKENPVAIAVMSDSDDTCGEAVAWFAEFRLLPAR